MSESNETVSEAPKPKARPTSLGYDFRPEHVLGKDGPIAETLPNYEVREPQIILAKDIQKAFEDEKHLIAEAATGTGKSFAAILAAIEKSLGTGTPVVISTHTIALQEQLYHKDIPFMLKRLKLPLKVCLAKGRNNYISLRRMANAAKRMNKNGDTQKQYQQIQDWLPRAKGENGSSPSKSDLPFKPLPMVWSAIRSDSDDCLGEKCPNFEKCHFQKAKGSLKDANIIVTNHTMVLLDRKMKSQGIQGILPEYNYLILDEAHEVETVARQVFTSEIKEYTIKSVLNELYSDDGMGLLNPLHAHYTQGSLVDLLNKANSEKADPKKQLVIDIVGSIDAILTENEAFFAKVERYLGDKKVKRFTKPKAISTTLFDLFKVFLDKLKDLPKIMSGTNDKKKIEYVHKRSVEIAMSLDKILTLPNAGKKYPEVVAWASCYFHPVKKIKNYGVTCAPIFLKPLMKKLIFSQIKSVVLISATLATGGKDPFTMVKSTLGMDNPMQRRLPPVFDYKKQVKAYLVTDMPEQSNPNYINEMAAQVEKFVLASNGGAFVLFTSRDNMKKVYEQTKDTFAMHDLDVFVQGGTMSRNAMISAFKETSKGVLFGVASFWTGVDIPGKALRNLIITKLPFSPPDDPLVQAQQEVYKQYKRNYFMERSLPETAIMLKQGFGRLIRRQSDRGVVVLLDSRLVTKRYGKFLIGSLPACSLKKISIKTPMK